MTDDRESVGDIIVELQRRGDLALADRLAAAHTYSLLHTTFKAFTKGEAHGVASGAPQRTAEGWTTAKRLTDYVRHRTTCALYHCGTCKAPIESDIHYVGTVDSHVLTPQTCDCGLSKLLAELYYASSAPGITPPPEAP